GLTDRVRTSQMDVEKAEAETLEFLMQYVPPFKSPMCGNSICQDRRFLFRYMPKLEKYFHYRNLDVSTVKMLAHYWAPEVLKKNPTKKGSQHLALQDIHDSILELKYYQGAFFTRSEKLLV